MTKKHTQTFREFKRSLHQQKANVNNCDDFVPEMIRDTVKSVNRELGKSNITKSESRTLRSQLRISKEKFQRKCK